MPAALTSIQRFCCPSNLVQIFRVSRFRAVVGVVWHRGKQGSGKSARGHGRDAQVVFMGPTGSGKTATMLRLRNALHVPTVPSMEPNKCILSLDDIRRNLSDENVGTADAKRHLQLLDMPGHPRLQADALAAVATCAGVMFFVDATDGDRIKEAAAFLYQALLILENMDKPPRLLLVFSKGDLPEARSVEYLISSLEREVERCRTTQRAALDEDETSRNFIGIPGKILDLRSDVASLQAVCSISAASGDVKGIAGFLIDLIDVKQ